MSILGFDAIGRLALGQMRVSGSNVVAGGAGSYVIGGNGAIFGLRTTGVATNYALAGNAAAFTNEWRQARPADLTGDLIGQKLIQPIRSPWAFDLIFCEV